MIPMPEGFPDRACFNRPSPNPWEVIYEAIHRLWEMPKSGSRRMIQSWKPEDRNFVFHNLDQASEHFQNAVLKRVSVGVSPPGARFYVSFTMREYHNRFELLRCQLDKQVYHKCDRVSGYRFCKTCAADLAFIGVDLKEAQKIY